MQAKAEQESQAIVARAQDEIRAERDRVFQELRARSATSPSSSPAASSGRRSTESAHERLIDDYIDQVAASGTNGRS